jgi:hypothetical protein
MKFKEWLNEAKVNWDAGTLARDSAYAYIVHKGITFRTQELVQKAWTDKAKKMAVEEKLNKIVNMYKKNKKQFDLYMKQYPLEIIKKDSKTYFIRPD